VLLIGLVAVISVGVAVRDQTNRAAARTAQVVAAQQVLERLHNDAGPPAAAALHTVAVGPARLEVVSTAVELAPGLYEARVAVGSHGLAGAMEIVTRLARPAE
jgi:hypothetical protein